MTVQDVTICDRDLTPELLKVYLQSSRIAVDTETMGLLPHRDRLCLVQLCDDKEQVSVIKITRGQTAAPHLKELMESTGIEKVFHFARFDVAALQHNLGIATQSIFCTKIASKLARTYSSRHGLKELVMELCGVELDKRAQSSDWGNADALSVEQLSYASNDVRYLIPMREQLESMLRREDRWDLAVSCFQCLPTFVNLDLRLYENIFEH
jgi:ribonuclease D